MSLSHGVGRDAKRIEYLRLQFCICAPTTPRVLYWCRVAKNLTVLPASGSVSSIAATKALTQSISVRGQGL